jgi:hypothetical protein
MLAHDPGYRAMVEMMDEQLQRSAFAPEPAAPAVDARRAVNAAAAAAADADDFVYDSDDENMKEDDDDVAMGASRPSNLHDMFEAPKHLMHKAGGFQGSRQVAKDSKRWLLVNIQKDSEFSSHALNRDVWRNDLVENLVREGFIFWQEVGLPKHEGCGNPRCIHPLVCSHAYLLDGSFSRRSPVRPALPRLRLSALGHSRSAHRSIDVEEGRLDARESRDS